MLIKCIDLIFLMMSVSNEGIEFRDDIFLANLSQFFSGCKNRENQLRRAKVSTNKAEDNNLILI